MDYEQALQAFYQPDEDDAPTPDPVARARPARRLRDASEPIAMHGVWSRTTNERLAALGLNFLTGYVWGRAASMGEPTDRLVVSAFAVFEPSLICGLYEEGRGHCARMEVLRAREEGTVESLRAVLGDADVTSVVTALRRGLGAADEVGRPLFSGLRSLGWPNDPFGQLWRACELIREHRGDSHVAACISAGLGPIAMNILTELWVGMPLRSYTATRAWSPDAIDAAVDRLRADGLLEADRLTDTGRALRDDIEARTDAMEQPIVDAIGADFETVLDRLEAWSVACVQAGAFPPSAFKRAAG
ncbi:MAG: hypothetical protein H0V51_16195 [Chloroflexi bacterium]|nr:hypothetical protein [Chloroflexota bacterium]